MEEQPPLATPERPAAFSRASTATYLLLWLALLAEGWAPLFECDPIWWMQYPARSADRMTSRDLELGEAISASPAPARAILEALYDTRENGLARSIEIQRALIEAVEEEGLPLEVQDGADEVSARLAVLLLESGEREEAASWLASGDPEFALALARAYGDGGDGTARARDDALLYAASLSGWYLDRVQIARARSEGDERAAAELEASLLARSRQLLWRVVSLAAANLALMGVGGLLGASLVLGHVRRRLTGRGRLTSRRRLTGRGRFTGRRRSTANAPGSGRAPFSLEDGLAVFIRGDFWNRAYFVAITSLAQLPYVGAALAGSDVVGLLDTSASLFASLPLLWLIHRHLLAPTRQSASTVFGLRPGLQALPSTLRIALVAIAVDLAGTYALGWAASALGTDSSFAEGFDESLVFGSASLASLSAIDYVVWTPVFEELAFRGVLYFSLRQRFGALSAAALTAAFFAALHFYTLPGFLMTFFSGFVWALAFERTRSLWPGIGSHAVYNLLYVLGLVLLYR